LRDNAAEAAHENAYRRRASEIRDSLAASSPAAKTAATTATAIISRRTVNWTFGITGAPGGWQELSSVL
jgi:hypothetical protein